MPQQLETLASGWANELADAMADVLADAPPVMQLEQLQPRGGAVAGFSSEAELRAQLPAMLPYRERQRAEQQQKQLQLQQRQQGRARDERRQQQLQLQQQARSPYEIQRDANIAENERKMNELFGPTEVGAGLAKKASSTLS